MKFKNDQERLAALKQRIQEELRHCEQHYRPQICQLKNDPTGYQRLEAEIIRMVSAEPIPIATAIALLETELEHSPNFNSLPDDEA